MREQIVNPDGSASDVNQPLPLPVGVTDMAIGSEPELWLLFAVLAVIAFVAYMRKRKLPLLEKPTGW